MLLGCSEVEERTLLVDEVNVEGALVVVIWLVRDAVVLGTLAPPEVA